MYVLVYLQESMKSDDDTKSIDLEQFADNISLSNTSGSTGEPDTPRVSLNSLPHLIAALYLIQAYTHILQIVKCVSFSQNS